MREDKNFCRRMVINKFSNTPPFHMKSFENSLRQNSKLKPPTRYSDDNVNYNRDSGNGDNKQSNNSNKNQQHISTTNNSTSINNNIINNNIRNNVVPRVLDNFRRIEPKQSNNNVKTFRRPKLGKNIPNHNMMNILLENLLGDDKIESNMEGEACDEMYIEINRDVRDTNSRGNIISHNAQKYFMNTHEGHIKNASINRNCQVRTGKYPGCHSTINNRVDEMTSTTGLHWVPENRKFNGNNRIVNRTNKCRCEMQRRSKLQIVEPSAVEILDSRSRTNIVEYVNPNIYTSPSSEFEQIPTKEVSYRKKKSKKNLAVVRGNKHFKCASELDENPVKQDESTTKSLQIGKTQSFVRLQVDKYNKLQTKETKDTSSIKTQQSTKIQQTTKPQPPTTFKKRIKMAIENKKLKEVQPTVDQSTLHCNLMHSVKTRVPKMQESDYDKCTESQDWSDCQNESSVTFPRETKHAMQKLINNRHSTGKLERQQVCTCVKKPKEEPEYSPSIKQQYKKLSVLPCHKNLLCNRGFHEGECVR